MADQTYTKAETLANMRQGWDGLNAYLATLTETQLTVPKDAGGWTIKDHVIHCAAWEGSMNAFFEGKPRAEYMGVSPEAWASGEIDRINDEIFRRNRDLSWAQVMATFRQAHDELIGRIEALSDEDLQKPYNYYQPGSPATDTAAHRLSIATYGHYAKHIPWMQAIAER